MQADDVINAALTRPRSAICPLFRPLRSAVEQFASGVFIQIGTARFLLTAAHVTDEQDIMIPGREGLVDLVGHYSYTRRPLSGERLGDRYDIAFVRLDDELAADLHPVFTFLDAPDAGLDDLMTPGDAYSVIGFPARRSSTSGRFAETSLLTLTGSGVPATQYEALGFSTRHHLVLQFRRKKALDSVSGRRTPPCLPEGMSGGGIFAWSKELPALRHFGSPHLAGIVHGYDASKSVFLGTRLLCYLRCIRDQHPELPIHRAGEPS